MQRDLIDFAALAAFFVVLLAWAHVLAPMREMTP